MNELQKKEIWKAISNSITLASKLTSGFRPCIVHTAHKYSNTPVVLDSGYLR